MSWNRKLWGVEFISPNNKPILICTLWMHEMPSKALYPGCPSRPILFTTRKAAREWCCDRTETTQSRGGVQEKWAFRAVRVQETVRRI